MIPKILIIHTVAWSHYAALTFSELYKLSINNNFDFFVIHLARTHRGREKIGDYDIKIHNYPHKILYNGFLENLSTVNKIRLLLKEIIDYKPTILITAGYSDPSIIFSVIFNKIRGGKNIITSDTTINDRARIWYKKLLKKAILKFFNFGFCIGTKQMEYLLSLGFSKNKLIKAGWYAIDYKDVSKTNKLINNFKKFNFIYVGRLSPEKNLKILINSFYEVKRFKNSNDWGLIIVGDGPQKEELFKLVNSLGIKNDIFFVGGRSWKEVVDFYTISDVFILPSISEPWGLVVNEAMIYGLPVIVSKRCGSYYDLVKEGVNGFGFDPFNQKELQEIMLKFINKEVDMKKMGEESKNIIKDYTPENAAKQMLTGIKKLLNI